MADNYSPQYFMLNEGITDLQIQMFNHFELHCFVCQNHEDEHASAGKERDGGHDTVIVEWMTSDGKCFI